MWTPDNPSRPGDEADDNPRVIANTVRALQREVRSGFELITQKVLDRLDRFDGKLDVVIDRQNIQEARLDTIERRLTALEANAPRRRALPLKRK